MRRIIQTSSLLLFSTVYLCAATLLLLQSRSVPCAGSGDQVLLPSTGNHSPASKPFWLQRRHLPLRTPLTFVDTPCILISRAGTQKALWIPAIPCDPAGDYHSYRSSLLDNKAPPVI